MASGTIQTLFIDKEHTEALFPVTKTKAVVNDDNVTLDTLLKNKVSTSTTINGQPLTSDVNIGASQIKSISFEAKQTFNDEQKEIIYHNVGMVQSDWNENDPSSYAYIKNRTHWTAEEEKQIVVKGDPVYGREEKFYYYVDSSDAYASYSQDPPVLEIGQEYKIFLNRNSDKQLIAEDTFVATSTKLQLGLHPDYGGSISINDNKITAIYGPETLETNDYELILQKITYSDKIEIVKEVVHHPLDIKYLPIPEATINTEFPALEKYQGKQVYVKMVEFGALPDGTQSIEFSSDDVTVIRISAYVVRNDGSSYTLPYIDPDTGASSILSGNFKAVFAYAENNNMTIRSTVSESSTVYATIWYIKN